VETWSDLWGKEGGALNRGYSEALSRRVIFAYACFRGNGKVGGGKDIMVSNVRGRGRCQGCERMVWEDVDKVQVCDFLTGLSSWKFLALDLW